MEQKTKDAILRTVSAFSDPAKEGKFIDGLTDEQYGALRDLNVERIDYGDDRAPTPPKLDPTLRIIPDEDGESPRSAYDNYSTMVCWHRRSNLGDEQAKNMEEYATAEDWRKANIPEDAEVLPLYLYEHSGMSMQTKPFGCHWDSGLVGFIYTTPEKIREAFMCKRITKEVRKKVRECMESEVKTYDQYLQGSVYGYVYTDEKGVEDSCWGFFGDTLEETGILEHLPEEARLLGKAAWDARWESRG